MIYNFLHFPPFSPTFFHFYRNFTKKGFYFLKIATKVNFEEKTKIHILLNNRFLNSFLKSNSFSKYTYKPYFQLINILSTDLLLTRKGNCIISRK